MPRPVPCLSVGLLSSSVHPRNSREPAAVPGEEALDTGAGLDGVCHPPQAGRVTALPEVPGGSEEPPFLRPGRVEIGHSPHLGLHPQDPDLEEVLDVLAPVSSLEASIFLCLLDQVTSPAFTFWPALPGSPELGKTSAKGI